MDKEKEVIYIQECADFIDYKKLVANFKEEFKYFILKDEGVLFRLKDSLSKENLDYSFSEVNTENLNEVDFKKALESHNEKIEASENIIAVFKNQEKHKWAGLHHGKLSNSKVIEFENFEELFSYLESNKIKLLTIVSDYTKVKSEYVKILQTIQKKYELYFSILTARNIESLVSLIIRNDIYKHHDLKVYKHINRLDHRNKEILEYEDLVIYPFDHATLDNFKKEFIERTNNVVTMIGHGRDDLFWLNDGGICARRHNDKNHDFDGKSKFTACAYNDRCFKENLERVRGHEVSARHLFLDCCNSAKLEGCVFEDDYNILFSFLDGHVVSYVGAPCVVNGQDFLNFYYMAQVLSNIPLGVAAGRVNNCYVDSKLGNGYAYYLIGDCAITLPGGTNKQEEIIEDFKGKLEHKFELKEDAYMFRISLNVENLIDLVASFRYRLNIYNSEGQTLYGVLRNDNNRTVIDVFSDSKIKKSDILVRLEEGREFNLEGIGNLENVLSVGLVPDNKFKPFLSETVQSGLKLTKINRGELYTFSSVRNVYKKIDKLHVRIDKLSEMLIKCLVDMIHEKGFSWDEHCMANGLIPAESRGKEEKVEKHYCPRCHKELENMIYAHEMYKRFTRVYECCPGCGIIKDSPEEKDDIKVSIEGKSIVKAGDSTCQKIVIENNSDKVLYGYTGIAIIKGVDNNITYDKKYEQVEIKPHEKLEVTINILFPENAVPHNYWLRGNAVLNGDIFSIRRDIWVIP